MFMDNLRISKDPDEIIKNLREGIKNKTSVTIWQNFGDERKVYLCRFKDINLLDKVLILEAPKNIDLELDGNITLYVRGHHKRMLFKQKIKYIANRNIITYIPKEVRLLELREEDRIYCKDEFIHFSKFRAYKANKKNFENRLFDISNHGAAFMMSNHQAPLIHEGETLFIHALGTHPIPPYLEATVLYIRGMNRKDRINSRNYYRVGIKFNKTISLKKRK